MGKIKSESDHNQRVLKIKLLDITNMPIAKIPDDQLTEHTCRKRSIFHLPYTATGSRTVKCLLPLRQVTSPYPFREEYIIAGSTADDEAPVTVRRLRWSEHGDGCDMLHEACNRPF